MTEDEIRAIVRDEITKNTSCSCQYGNDNGNFTPYWYASVRTCPRHHQLFRPQDTPAWYAA